MQRYKSNKSTNLRKEERPDRRNVGVIKGKQLYRTKICADN
jgi:hypothetical protein